MMRTDLPRVTRLAPSPTGSLHLGNARTFLANWLLARQRGWRIVLRIDDTHGPRNQPGADRQAMEDLAWLGIDWDDGPVYQSHFRRAHDLAIEKLQSNAPVYFDTRTRREIEADANGRTGPDGATVDPGTGRDRHATLADAEATGRSVSLRLRVPAGEARFTDGFAGDVCYDWTRELGDFPIRTAAGEPSYQLATVVDDAAARITDVVRGDDLLASTPRQMLIYQHLDLHEHMPNYYHLPLVVGGDGRKLSKRHGDTRIASYRETGRPAADVMTLLAGWLGMAGSAATAGDLLSAFTLAHVSREPIVFEAPEATR